MSPAVDRAERDAAECPRAGALGTEDLEKAIDLLERLAAAEPDRWPA